MSGTAFVEAVIDGVLTGGVYALMAAGLTLIFGVMDIINIAQGALIVLGAYMSYVLSVHLGIDLFAGAGLAGNLQRRLVDDFKVDGVHS